MISQRQPTQVTGFLRKCKYVIGAELRSEPVDSKGLVSPYQDFPSHLRNEEKSLYFPKHRKDTVTW